MSYKDIIWGSDKTKFRNPKGKTLKDAFKGFSKPKFWTKEIYELDEKDPLNNGFQNHDFIVWMRVAAFSTFQKLYRRLDREAGDAFRNGLPAGHYKLNVQYNYPTEIFHGRKRFILSSTSWMGGKNGFLGRTFVIVGFLSFILAFVSFMSLPSVRNLY